MTQMNKLMNLLDIAEIPYEVTENLGTPQVWYPSRKNVVCDVICHQYSYGGRDGLLEIMGLVNEEDIGDEVEGYLDAIEVFCRIFNNYYGKEPKGE